MSSQVPRYLRQRRRGKSDSALVIINGNRIHLGKYDSPKSRQRYAERIPAPT